MPSPQQPEQRRSDRGGGTPEDAMEQKDQATGTNKTRFGEDHHPVPEANQPPYPS